MIKLKDDEVRPGNGFGLLLGIIIVERVFAAFGIYECVITSLNDSKHSKTSLHYADNAADIRIWNIPSFVDKEKLMAALRDALNVHYDVILFDDHIHLEFQPRGGL